MRKGKLTSMRTLSKNSVEIRVENFKLPPVERETTGQLVKCYLCSSLLSQQATLPNTTHSNTRICRMCYTQTFDKSYITFTRYNNYLSNDPRPTSLSKQPPPQPNPMKMSMLPPEPTGKEPQRLNNLLKFSVPAKVDKRETWE